LCLFVGFFVIKSREERSRRQEGEVIMLAEMLLSSPYPFFLLHVFTALAKQIVDIN